MSDAGERVIVLHLLSRLDYGGVEVWLANVCGRQDNSGVRHRVLVSSIESDELHARFQAAGSEVDVVPRIGTFGYLPNLARIIRREKRVGTVVVHSHLAFYSALPLMLALVLGVRNRIAHSHNAGTKGRGRASPLRLALRRVAAASFRVVATQRVACSSAAGRYVFGRRSFYVLPYGIDDEAFHTSLRASCFRSRDAGQPRLVHVGSFTDQKNHDFLLDLAAELMRRGERFTLAMIGEGPNRTRVEQAVRDRDLGDHVIIVGRCSDVPGYLVQKSDVLLLPSLYEGLGLVAVEGQAAGLTVIVSKAVPSEADVVPGRVLRLGIAADDVFRWADAVCSASTPDEATRRACADVITRSAFARSDAQRRFQELYLCS